MLPIKTISGKRLAYLDSLAISYKEMGYSVKVDGRTSILEVYPKGAEVPKTDEELTIERWTD